MRLLQKPLRKLLRMRVLLLRTPLKLRAMPPLPLVMQLPLLATLLLPLVKLPLPLRRKPLRLLLKRRSSNHC